MSKKIFFLLLIVGSSSCAIKKHFQQSIFNEASSIQLVAQKKGELAAAALEEVIQQANSIQVQGRELTRSEMEFINQVNNVRGEFQKWEYSELKLPAVETIRLKEKENILQEQVDWKKEIEVLLDKITEI